VLLTLFTSGLGLIAYAALIFLMPEATTPEQVAAARGQPFNAQELVERARRRHAQFRARHSARRRGQRMEAAAAEGAAAPHGPVPRQPGPAARLAGGVMLPVFTVMSAAWFGVAAVAAILLWHGFGSAWSGWYPRQLQLTELPRWLPLAALAAVYLLLALPISAARRTALYYANGGRAHGWADAWSGLLWFALVAVVLLAAWILLPELQDLLRDLSGWRDPIRVTHGI
jgi:hypothetical protein